MQKLLSIFLLAALPTAIFAQELDSLQSQIDKEVDSEMRTQRNPGEMKTLFGGQYHTGGYFAINFKGHNYFGEDVLILGTKWTGVLNRSLGIGFEVDAMLPSVKVDDIELVNLPEGGSMRPVIGYGGLLIEPIILSNQPVHITFPVLFGAGWVGYFRDWNDKLQEGEKELLDDAVFFVFEPGVNVELNLTRSTRLGLGVSYRTTDNFDLENTSQKAFNGINLNMMLKFGRA
jgi:hypothetical protein